MIPNANILGSILEETEPLRERVIAETSKQLFDIKKLLMIADLSTDQINYFFKLIIVDDLFYRRYCLKGVKGKNGQWVYTKVARDNQAFTEIWKKLLQLTISKNRQSRSEIVDMFKILRVEASDEKRGLLRR